MQPTPPGTLVRPDFVALFERVKHPIRKRFGIFVVTRRYAFFVEKPLARLSLRGLSMDQRHDFVAAWRAYLTYPALSVVELERRLIQELMSDDVIDFSKVTVEVKTGAWSRGFYYRERGAWTSRVISVMGAEDARLLEAFVASPPPPPQVAGGPQLRPGLRVQVLWSDGAYYAGEILASEPGRHLVLLQGGRREWIAAANVFVQGA